jgi:L-iditol 2-dehydrogenase
MLEPLGVAIHALDLGTIPVGARVGIYGCGPVGLLLVQLALVAGASRVVATDLLPHRVAAAASLGADAVQVDDADVPVVGADSHTAEPDAAPPGITAGRRAVRRAIRDEPVDVAFEVAGSDAALADAIAAVRPGGRVVIVGIPGSDRTGFAAGVARRKELSLVISRRMLATDLDRAIGLTEAGRIILAPLITDRFPLARAVEAFAMAETRGGLKVVIDPTDATSIAPER